MNFYELNYESNLRRLRHKLCDELEKAREEVVNVNLNSSNLVSVAPIN